MARLIVDVSSPWKTVLFLSGMSACDVNLFFVTGSSYVVSFVPKGHYNLGNYFNYMPQRGFLLTLTFKSWFILSHESSFIRCVLYFINKSVHVILYSYYFWNYKLGYELLVLLHSLIILLGICNIFKHLVLHVIVL